MRFAAICLSVLWFTTGYSQDRGIASSVGAAKSGAVNGAEITYVITLENLGSTDFFTLSVPDDLDTVFGSGNYQIISGPTATGTLMSNIGFDGSSDTELLDPASTLSSGSLDTVSYTVEIIANNMGTYTNQVTVTAQAVDMPSVSDVSDDGTDPDPNGTGDAGDPGEDDPTIVTNVTPVLLQSFSIE